TTLFRTNPGTSVGVPADELQRSERKLVPVPSSPDPAPPEEGRRPEHPPMTQISVLADAIGARVEIVNAAAGDDAARAAAVTGIDLRAQGIRPGDVFAALPGARAHGASFAGTALERGAVAVLTDEAGRDLVAEA